MIMSLIGKLVTLGALLCAIELPGLSASITYDYTGHHFTTDTSPFTGTDFVTGSVTLSTPLPLNAALTDYSADVTAFSLTDGYQTIATSTNADDEFYFATTNGAITQWAVEVFNQTTTGGVGTVSVLPSNDADVIDFGELCHTACSGTNYYTIGYVYVTPGAWSVDTSSAAPEPSNETTILLVFIGMGLIAASRMAARKTS